MKPLARLNAPYRADSPLPLWLFLSLVVLAGTALIRLANEPRTADAPVDFRPLYLGQSILLTGGDPYDDQLLKDTWRSVVHSEDLESVLLPGHPYTRLLYPPWTLPLFTVFAGVPWMTARVIWWLAVSFFLLGIAWLVSRAAPAASRWTPMTDTLLLALAFRATDWALFVGQPMFLCLLLGFAACHFDRTGRPALAGIALGLASFKVTLVVPFAVMIFYRRRWSVLLVAAVTGLVLIAAFVILSADPAGAVDSFRSGVAHQRAFIFRQDHPGYPLAFKMLAKTQLAALAECIIPGAGRHSGVVNLLPALLILPFWIVPLWRRQVSDVRAFPIFAVLSLLCTYHLHYDALVLLPIYLMLFEADRAERIALLVSSAFLLLPITGVLNQFDVPPALNFLFYNFQIGLLVLAVVLTWGMRRAIATPPK